MTRTHWQTHLIAVKHIFKPTQEKKKKRNNVNEKVSCLCCTNSATGFRFKGFTSSNIKRYEAARPSRLHTPASRSWHGFSSLNSGGWDTVQTWKTCATFLIDFNMLGFFFIFFFILDIQHCFQGLRCMALHLVAMLQCVATYCVALSKVTQCNTICVLMCFCEKMHRMNFFLCVRWHGSRI